jgi:hypothetical protein
MRWEFSGFITIIVKAIKNLHQSRIGAHCRRNKADRATHSLIHHRRILCRHHCSHTARNHTRTGIDSVETDGALANTIGRNAGKLGATGNHVAGGRGHVLLDECFLKYSLFRLSNFIDNNYLFIGILSKFNFANLSQGTVGRYITCLYRIPITDLNKFLDEISGHREHSPVADCVIPDN